MSKFKINFIIDILLLIFTGAIIGIGFLMQFVLLPGFKIFEVYRERVSLTFLELSRHEWGEIHLYLGYIFFVLLLIHLILHIDIVNKMLQKCFPNRCIRVLFVSGIIFLTIVTLGFSFLISPTVHKHGRGRHVEIVK